MEWNRTYGTGENASAKSLVQTSDGGYVLAGLSGAGVDAKSLLIKVDSDGYIQWNKTYGGSNSARADDAYSMVQTSDGGYTILGNTWTKLDENFYGYPRPCLYRIGTELGLAWTDSTPDTITLYRGATDPYWNFVRVRIWKPAT